MKPFCFSLSGIYESEGYAWEQAGKIWDCLLYTSDAADE